MTIGPAEAFALGARVPGIGRIEAGLSADLVVFDPAAAWTVDPSNFASRGKNTPLAGQTIFGTVRLVVLRGEIALHNREVTLA